MKKLFVILLLLTISFSLFAWKELDYTFSNQDILAYINGILDLEVSSFKYAGANDGKGINLNIKDENNNFRYLIAPTATPQSVPGLLIANFSLISSSSNYKLTISHNELVNNTNNTIKYDYELCTIYSVQKNGSNIERTDYCTSSPDNMVLNFNEIQGILMLQNAGLYLRLCTEVTDPGEYSSTITLFLESLT